MDFSGDDSDLSDVPPLTPGPPKTPLTSPKPNSSEPNRSETFHHPNPTSASSSSRSSPPSSSHPPRGKTSKSNKRSGGGGTAGTQADAKADSKVLSHTKNNETTTSKVQRRGTRERRPSSKILSMAQDAAEEEVPRVSATSSSSSSSRSRNPTDSTGKSKVQPKRVPSKSTDKDEAGVAEDFTPAKGTTDPSSGGGGTKPKIKITLKKGNRSGEVSREGSVSTSIADQSQDPQSIRSDKRRLKDELKDLGSEADEGRGGREAREEEEGGDEELGADVFEEQADDSWDEYRSEAVVGVKSKGRASVGKRSRATSKGDPPGKRKRVKVQGDDSAAAELESEVEDEEPIQDLVSESEVESDEKVSATKPRKGRAIGRKGGKAALAKGKSNKEESGSSGTASGPPRNAYVKKKLQAAASGGGESGTKSGSPSEPPSNQTNDSKSKPSIHSPATNKANTKPSNGQASNASLLNKQQAAGSQASTPISSSAKVQPRPGALGSGQRPRPSAVNASGEVKFGKTMSGWDQLFGGGGGSNSNKSTPEQRAREVRSERGGKASGASNGRPTNKSGKDSGHLPSAGSSSGNSNGRTKYNTASIRSAPGLESLSSQELAERRRREEESNLDTSDCFDLLAHAEIMMAFEEEMGLERRLLKPSRFGAGLVHFSGNGSVKS
ncbi:hypothetical protein IE53DRAFT_88170 [Violaceomyces palustris]|uniref:Uncharacterized protein n=1 Tax=Violaceomyces palustris TaxID=1673888 RepID=A0ACD0NXS1_9BASI|nr:hypothetical protein IE53DRAFT_88170 [Violaceomyces palustris]